MKASDCEHPHNALNLRLSAFMAALLCALFITAMPAVALADQPDTDIVCGTAESERQDAAADRPDISALHASWWAKTAPSITSVRPTSR